MLTRGPRGRTADGHGLIAICEGARYSTPKRISSTGTIWP